MLKILNEYDKAYENIKNFVQDEDNAGVWTKSYLLALDEDLEVLRKLVDEKTNKPTLEEVKKEWEELEYGEVWNNEPNSNEIRFRNSNETEIVIYTDYKVYFKYNSYRKVMSFTLKEHQLLTKTYKALGWFDE